MNPNISVIIPAYNRAAYLPATIASALDQTVTPLEVIVVDDGSTDETARILESYRGRVRYLFQENKGPAAARNRGVAVAEGDLIAFLDADDIWLPEKLERQLACLADQPRAGLVHSDVMFWDERTGAKCTRANGRQEFVGYCYRQFFDRNRVLPSTVLVRRECLDEVGGFDETIRRPSTEDYDLCFRIARRHELAYVDEPLILYRMHESNATSEHLTILEGTLYVVRKALRDDPDLARVVGRRKVDERLFQLLSGIGYQHFEAQRHAEARHYFRQALGHRPGDAYAWFLYLVNLLPSAWVGVLRRLKTSTISAVRKRGGSVTARG